jgi:phosphomannomutase
LVGIVFILNLIRWTNQSLAELVDRLPKYAMEKTKVTLPTGANLENIYQRIQDHFKNASINLKDGLRLDWPSQWVHIRPSNTEPVVRIIGEAPTKAELDTLLRACEDIVLS